MDCHKCPNFYIYNYYYDQEEYECLITKDNLRVNYKRDIDGYPFSCPLGKTIQAEFKRIKKVIAV